MASSTAPPGHQATQMAPPPTLTRKQFAPLINRSLASFDRDEQLGRLPRSFRIGNRKLWRRAEVEAWLEAGCPTLDVWEAMKK